MKKYDLAIIGGGPGGYVAAIRAAQLNKKVAIIESTHLGGICLNWGCIPTKSLLKNAEVLDLIKNSKQYGINIKEYSVEWNNVIKRSRDIANRMGKGIQFLMKKNKIDVINGYGKILNKNIIEVGMFTKDQLHAIFQWAEIFRMCIARDTPIDHILKGKIK